MYAAIVKCLLLLLVEELAFANYYAHRQKL